MIITKRTPTTVIDLWFPRYSSKYTEAKDYVFLPATYKVRQGERVIIIEFSKAKHMKGLKFCMLRDDIMKYPIQSNGRIPCYSVPQGKWKPVETPEDIKRILTNLWPNEEF